MGIYWPAFEFTYRLDISRLFPHIAAIERYREASANRILPPAWREKSESARDDSSSPHLSAEEQSKMDAIARRKYDVLVRNASKAQAWVRERFLPGSDPISLQDILILHRMAAEESGLRYKDSGALRSSPVVVGRAEVGGVHAGAPAEKLPRLMERYVAFMNGNELRSLPPAIHALLAHFFFTTIHPFADGNGRLCRLVSAAILFQRGYKGHGLYSLSRYFYHNDLKYHTLLHQCWQQPLPFDLTRFVAFGLEGLVLELQDLHTFLKMKLDRAVEREAFAPALRKKQRARLRQRFVAGN